MQGLGPCEAGPVEVSVTSVDLAVGDSPAGVGGDAGGGSRADGPSRDAGGGSVGGGGVAAPVAMRTRARVRTLALNPTFPTLAYLSVYTTRTKIYVVGCSEEPPG